MAVDFPDNPALALDDYWRLKLEEAERRYLDNPNAETRAEFLRVLRIFADLVMRNQLPPPVERSGPECRLPRNERPSFR